MWINSVKGPPVVVASIFISTGNSPKRTPPHLLAYQNTRGITYDVVHSAATEPPWRPDPSQVGPVRRIGEPRTRPGRFCETDRAGSVARRQSWGLSSMVKVRRLTRTPGTRSSRRAGTRTPTLPNGKPINRFDAMIHRRTTGDACKIRLGFHCVPRDRHHSYVKGGVS